ncbi:hypothetical protein KBC54_01685 [Patescibacteria group bacterium]|nr:hypothetical protein [Patescibacteria group bacterium]
MHRRTASALRQVPAPSRSIDFRAVSAPPGWGRVIPFVPRRRTAQVPAPVPEASVDSEIAERIRIAEEQHRFLMGEGGHDPLPAAEPRQEAVGLLKKPTPPKVIAQARGRRQEEIDKALKNGRKFIQGRMGAGASGRPTLSSSQYGIRHPRSSKKKSSKGAAREPSPVKQPEPLPTLDDARYLYKAEHAWKRCNPQRIEHHEEVLHAALVVQYGDTAFGSVVEYLVHCTRAEVAQAQESGERVTHSLLRRMADRALSRLIKWVWECVRYSQPYSVATSSSHPHRPIAWERKRHLSVALSPFSVYVCRHSTLTEGREVFFVLEHAKTKSPTVHKLMSDVELGQWLRKLKPCCLPVRPPRLHLVDDDEGDFAS